MKKFSTQILALAFSLTSLIGSAALAQSTPPLELAKDAPDRYVVVKGDTLWDISGRFLKKPWRWPEIWQLNREQIHNPHLIYPGDVVILDTSGAAPRLRLGRAVGSGGGAGADGSAGALASERLQPRVRVQALAPEAIATIDSTAIEAFLNRPLVVDEAAQAAHPRIVATQEGRVYLARGELAYVRGMPDEAAGDWYVYRPAKPLLDPDTRKPIAWEALFVGTAKVERGGDPATLRIVSTNEEIGVGDRLMPSERAMPITYAPHPPDSQVAGRIVAVYRGLTQVGRNNVVALNVGKSAGLEIGNVLAINHRGQVITDKYAGKSTQVKLPDEPVGHLLIFRVFDKIAYGLVMEASQPISVGDDVANP